MKAKLIRDMPWGPTSGKTGTAPAGTVLDNPRCWLLVQMGVAIPEDEECRVKADMSEAAMAQAQKAYEKVEKGIHPDDYAAYDAGLMTGYNPDGTMVPGPNAEPEEEEESLIYVP